MLTDSSTFQYIFHVRKRAWIDELASDFTEIGAIENNVLETLPLAVSFCKASKNSHIFAVSDEAGYVNLFDSRRELSSAASYHENAEKARIDDWLAHQNAIFDVCWIKEDTHILTASGDQTIKVWDAQDKKCAGVLMGHTGSVKCLSSHPTNSGSSLAHISFPCLFRKSWPFTIDCPTDLVLSGSRDGSFAIWDLRCKSNSKSRCDEVCHPSTSMVKGAHLSSQARRGRRGKAAAASITSVIYLKDEISIATSGAADRYVRSSVISLRSSFEFLCICYIMLTSYPLPLNPGGYFSVVKFWDTRSLKSNVTQACPRPESSTQKAAISPDGDHVLSGSSDGDAYIWKVNKPLAEPIILKGHKGEVTAVDWCPSEVGKIATSADDFTVRLWNIEPRYCSSTRLPSSVRRRVMAVPSAESSKLLVNETVEPMDQIKQPGTGSSYSSDEALQIYSSSPATASLLRTPEAQKKKFPSTSESNETFEKTPEATMRSPTSVLNPPSSLKRKTIRDYFLTIQ
ncbi:hypothetical protein CXB51_030236 [Gossypium anomalum]|uniref:Denticleless protein-like protein n=1 Tax=Gossypium anomalum TaxID=47600 RepID=A0A8J5Y8F4_9ROSI|nr:hypothetical protein CXB51_030236 [Gossypium anomalum]